MDEEEEIEEVYGQNTRTENEIEADYGGKHFGELAGTTRRMRMILIDTFNFSTYDDQLLAIYIKDVNSEYELT